MPTSPNRGLYPSAHSKLSVKLQTKYPFTFMPSCFALRTCIKWFSRYSVRLSSFTLPSATLSGKAAPLSVTMISFGLLERRQNRHGHFARHRPGAGEIDRARIAGQLARRRCGMGLASRLGSLLHEDNSHVGSAGPQKSRWRCLRDRSSLGGSSADPTK